MPERKRCTPGEMQNRTKPKHSTKRTTERSLNAAQTLEGGQGRMGFFYGSFEHSMDAKGRVSLPSTFRKDFGEGTTLVLAPGTDGEVNVFTQEGFKKWLDSLFEEDGGFKASNREHQRRRRYYMSPAKQVEFDKAGRISVPANLIERGKLGKTVLVNGEDDHVALWNPEVFDSLMGDYNPGEMYED